MKYYIVKTEVTKKVERVYSVLANSEEEAIDKWAEDKFEDFTEVTLGIDEERVKDVFEEGSKFI
jgi:hypothetical protein